MASEDIVVKVVYQQSGRASPRVHRLSLAPAGVSFDVLLRMVLTWYPELEHEKQAFSLKCQDAEDERDWIVLSTDTDVKEAICVLLEHKKRILRIMVEQVRQGQAATAATKQEPPPAPAEPSSALGLVPTRSQQQHEFSVEWCFSGGTAGAEYLPLCTDRWQQVANALTFRDLENVLLRRFVLRLREEAALQGLLGGAKISECHCKATAGNTTKCSLTHLGSLGTCRLLICDAEGDWITVSDTAELRDLIDSSPQQSHRLRASLQSWPSALETLCNKADGGRDDDEKKKKTVSPAELTRQARHVYVGGLPAAENDTVAASLSEHDLLVFLTNAAPSMGISTPQPIVSVTLNTRKRFCFVEFRSVQDTTLSLDAKISLRGCALRVRRPADYILPPPHLLDFVLPPVVSAAEEAPVVTQLSSAEAKWYIPVETYPHVNFIGLLLGPRGATLKRLEQETQCKLSIRGKGTSRAQAQEQEQEQEEEEEEEEEPVHVLIRAAHAALVQSGVKAVQTLLAHVMQAPTSSETAEAQGTASSSSSSSTHSEMRAGYTDEALNKQLLQQYRGKVSDVIAHLQARERQKSSKELEASTLV